MTPLHHQNTVQLYWELLKIGARQNKKLVLLIFLADMAGAACQMAVIAVLAISARLATNPATIEAIAQIQARIIDAADYLGSMIGFKVDETIWILGIASSFVLLAISVLMIFTGARAARYLARRYHEASITMLMSAAFQPTSSESPLGVTSETEYKIAIMQDALQAGKALEMLSRIGQVSVFLAIAIVIAGLLQPFVSLGLAVLTIFFVPFVVRVSRSINRNSDEFFNVTSRQYGILASKVISEQDGRLGFAERFIVPSPILDPMHRDRIRYFNAYDRLQLSSERMALFTGILRTLGFGFALITLTGLVFLGKATITDIVIFAAVLYVSLSFLQQILSFVATLSIYQPQVRRHLRLRRYLNNIFQSSEDRRTAKTASKTLVCCSHAVDCSVLLKPGTVVDLAISFPPGRFNQTTWFEPLRGATDPQMDIADVFLLRVGEQFIPETTPGDISDCLQSKLNITLDNLVHITNSEESWERWKIANIGADGDGLNATSVSRMDGRLQGLFAHALALSSNKANIFLDRGILMRFEQPVQNTLKELYKDKVLWLFRTTEAKGKLQVECTIFVTNAKTIRVVVSGSNAAPTTQPPAEPSLAVDLGSYV